MSSGTGVRGGRRGRLSRLINRPTGDGRPSDGGFILLESIIAISLVTVVMTALTTFLVTTLASSTHARVEQSATQLADSAVELVRGVGGSGAISGRGSASVTSEFATAPAVVVPWLSTMTQASDSGVAASAGATAALPTTPVTQVVNNTSYQIGYYVGNCYRATSTSSSCVATPTTGIQMIRVVVSVTWGSTSCASASCGYVTATLLSGTADPVFDLNQAGPPQPIIVNPGSQTSAIGDTVSLQLNTSQGVPTFTWTATGLPSGLVISTAGLITGSPTTTTGSPFTVTATTTDSFLDTATASFSWTILPKLTFTNPGPQVAIAGQAITKLTLAATGGAGAPYTWAATGLPSGLSMSSAGAVTGTPSMTTPYSSPFTVRVTVTDSSTKRTYSDSFTWTVGFPPLVASNPGTQTSTVNRAITSTTLTATGGSGSYAWSDPSTTLPPGVTISSAGVITGTPTATGSFSVSLKVVDTSTVPPSNSPQTVSFSWKVNVAPSVMTPANQHGEATVAATNLTVAASGGTSPYSFTAAGLPTGLSINSASGVISGTPTTAGTFSVTVTVTDAFGATATSGAFSWTIVAAPIVTVPNQVTQRSTTVSLSIAPDVSGGSGTYSTYAATGLPSGLSISATTGVISGKTASSSSKSTVTITVTDSAGAKATTTFTWWVTNLAITSPGNQSTRHGTAASVSLSASGGTSPYTYTATNLPSWLSVSGTKIVGTAPATTGVTSNITVTVTDSTGAFVTSTTFTWTVT